jgi:GH15 family glucan-1,4-alpha-glucosidase
VVHCAARVVRSAIDDGVSAVSEKCIEDYALIGDRYTSALVSRSGSIDWLCLPRFDSGACFAALLGDDSNGRWLVTPRDEVRRSERHYRDGTLILETDYETEHGSVTVTDCMPTVGNRPDVIRSVTGKRGRVAMRMEIVLRFDYGSIVPWVQRTDGARMAVAGPDAVELRTPVHLHGKDFRTVADFEVVKGQTVTSMLTWYASHKSPPKHLDPDDAITKTEHWWHRWSQLCQYEGPWKEAVQRSLITLKALTYAPTGGIVAAPTTSLPEEIGGERNWDYRYCWVRDATFTLYSLLTTGYKEEARAWREWLLRAAAGRPDDLQIMYGVAGERRLTEMEVGWLPGFAGSKPVRIGNAAHDQLQLDVYGEILDALHVARRHGVELEQPAWKLQRKLLDFLESSWEQPDEGIWEVRGPRRQFTHSKVMAWVAFDRAVKAVERFGASGPTDRWRALRRRIHDEVCREAFDRDRNTFVRYYGSNELDASLLLIPLVGFLPADDARMRGTVDAIRRELDTAGFIRRYLPSSDVEGVTGDEGMFLPCSFWLADNLAMQGRDEEARELFERLLEVRNDVGLLAEEYDPHRRRMLGNFPQALSHVALVNTAYNLTAEHCVVRHRPSG